MNGTIFRAEMPDGKDHFDVLKLFPDENIILVQRQHWIVLLVPILFNIAIFIALGLAGYIGLIEIKNIPIMILPTIAVYFFLVIIAIIGMVAVYIFMQWYYQFYVITDKRLVHIHFFHIGGFYFEEVFFERLLEREIERHASNVVYDLCNVEDVIVFFESFEQTEPFIFKAPSHAEVIEEILNGITHKKPGGAQ